jgi:hypothetical protein
MKVKNALLVLIDAADALAWRSPATVMRIAVAPRKIL